MNRRDRRPDKTWVNMGQQRNPDERFASRFDGGEVPDPLGRNDWDGDGYVRGDDDNGEVLA